MSRPLGQSSGRIEFTLLLVFTALNGALLAFYERHDGGPPTYDDAWYLETSLHFYDAIRSGDAVRLVYEYCGALGGIKAPLISVLPLPFYFAFGKRIDPTFWVNGVFLVATNFYLYALARRWFPPVVGLLSVVLYQTFPITAGLSHAYMTDYGLAALVIAFLYHLAASDRLRDAGSNVALGLIFGLGLMMKILFPAFVAAPLLLSWIKRHQEADTPRTSRLAAKWPLVTIGLIGGLIAFPWYALNLWRVLVFAWSNAFGAIGEDYESPSIAAWFLGLPHQGISIYYACACALLIPAAFIILRRRGEVQWREHHGQLLAWFLPAGIALVLAGSAVLRFALPILPAVAIVLSCSMVVVASAISGRREIQALLLIAVLATPLAAFASITLGGPIVPGSIYQQTYWFRTPGNEGQWNQVRILDTLRKLAPGEQPPYPVIVGIEHRYLNANLLSYLKYREDGPFRFAAFGYAETSVARAIEQIDGARPRFILMAQGIDEQDLAPFLNRVNEPIQELLDNHTLPFHYRTTIQLTNEIAVLVYESDHWPFPAPAGAISSGPQT